MGVLTPFFNLFKPAKTDPLAISRINSDLDIIDTELHRPPLTVNQTEPDSETRDIHIETVPLANDLSSDQAQINQGTYVLRTSGGEASIEDGSAWLSEIRGNMVKTGYVAESLDMTVTLVARQEGEDGFTASIDRDTFVSYVSSSGTITLTYSTEWSADPANYGVTITGTPKSGDQIVIVYVKENRGTITTATPTSFVSTGWNLYNHASGYARVLNYSEEYGFMIEGNYTALAFAETLSGTQTTITPVNGYFTVPSDGYVFVTGGDSTTTEIWMTWSDWTEEPNDGTFEAYSQTSIDLSGVMVNFPDGLMKIGNVYDEINLNTGRAYSRIRKIEYSDENLEDVIASGVAYDTDTGYIYAVRELPVALTISVDGEYTVSDHGLEMFLGTSVPLTAASVYGNSLKNKLERDVLTISQQTLTAAQQAQVRTNIDVRAEFDNLSRFTVSKTSLSAVETELNTIVSGMSNNQVRIGRLYANYAGSMTNGERSAAILYRIDATTYRCEIFNTGMTGYYYSNAWHWKYNGTSKLQTASLLYTFTGTGSTSVNLAYNASNFAFVMALLLDSSGNVAGTSFLNPTIAHNREVKIYGESSSMWGSWKLTNNGTKCTFNRTSATTTSVLLYGVCPLIV